MNSEMAVWRALRQILYADDMNKKEMAWRRNRKLMNRSSTAYMGIFS